MSVILMPSVREEKKVTGVSLFDRQITELDELANQLGLDRSLLVRMCIDRALPDVRRQFTTPNTADSRP